MVFVTTSAFLLAILFLTANPTSFFFVSALYDNDENHVTTFTSSKDFRTRILESNGISLVQFYAPWCGHCQKFAPAYKEMAKIFNGMVTVGAIDASSDGPLQRIAGEYGVSSFPTLKIFKPSNKKGKNAVVVDVSSRNPNDIVNDVMTAMSQTIQERAGSSSGGNDDNGGDGKKKRSNSGNKSKSAVKELTLQNFSQHVYDSDNIVAIAFIAPWCGHCKNLLPEWNAAAQQLAKSGATLATVDATQEEQLASQFQVQGYPTIKLFPGGKKSGPLDAVDYQGGRTKEQIVSAILAEVDRSGVPKEIPELINQSVLEDTCGSSGGSGQNLICVVVALPHILETGAAGRNKYKTVMTNASNAVRGMSFEFVWFEGGNHQHKLENALELTFGFPAVAAYSAEKQVFAVHRGSFTESNVRKFLMGIMAGKMGTYPMRTDLVVVDTEPWDGKDGVPIEEESLEDIMGWDDDDDYGDAQNDEL